MRRMRPHLDQELGPPSATAYGGEDGDAISVVKGGIQAIEDPHPPPVQDDDDVGVEHVVFGEHVLPELIAVSRSHDDEQVMYGTPVL